MNFKIPSIKMPWGKRSPGKTPHVKLPPDSPTDTDSPAKVVLGRISVRKDRPVRLSSTPGPAFVRASMRPLALGLLLLSAIGLVASLVVTIWPKVLWVWAAIDADTAFALMRLLPIVTACLAVLAGVLCIAFAPASPASGNQLPADPLTAAPAAGDSLADSGLIGVVRELQTILAGEQAKVSSFEELCAANGREARTMAAHVTRLSEASRDAEGRLTSAVERATAALRQPPQADAAAANAVARPERAPMDMSDVILRRITEQTRVIGMTLDGAVGRMAAETESSVHAFRSAVIDATVHIAALGETAVVLRRDVIALDTAGREIATAGATVISRVGGAVANVDAALIYLPAAAAAVTSAAELAGQTLAEAAAVLCADSAAIEACARETRQTAELLQREAATLATTKQEIAGAGYEAIASVAQTVETAAVRLAAVIAEADSARQGPDALAAITTTLEQVAATLADGASNAVEAACVLRADAAASGHEMRQAAEMMQQEASAMGTARQEIHGAGVAAGQTVEAATARLAAVLADADSARQGPDALTEITTTLEQVAAALADGAANTADAAAVLRADAAASGHEMRTAAKMVQREASALTTARQEITGAGSSAGRTVEAAAAKLAADLRQGSAVLAATLETASATLATAALEVKSATDGLCTDSAASSRDTRQAAESVQREVSALGAANQDIAHAGALAARNVDDATARLTSVIADAERAGQSSALAFETATARLADAAASGEVGHDKLASVTQTLEAAAAQLTAVIADASGPDLTASLETATATLVDAAASLGTAGQRVVESGDRVADQIASGIASSQAVMAALPDVRAELTSATADLRLETFVLTAAAQQISAAGTAATSAVTEAAIRAETATTSLATAGRAMNASSAEAALQIDRLGGVTRQAETQISLLPGVAAEIGAASGRLRDMTEVPDALRSILPDAAARIEAAALGLDRLDALSRRLEVSVDGLPAAPAREASMMTLITLSADICEAVQRVEAALSAHDGVWPAVAASMAKVEAAAVALAQATTELTPVALPERAPPSGTPAALAATLRQLDDVTAQTETLLRQTEALAEAVIGGHAPGLAVLLADRTPELLAGLDSMTRRMRSVATALALVNDGVPAMEQGSRRTG